MTSIVEYYKIESTKKGRISDNLVEKVQFPTERAALVDIIHMARNTKAKLYTNGKLKGKYCTLVYNKQMYLIRIVDSNHWRYYEVLVNGKWEDHIGDVHYRVEKVNLQTNKSKRNDLKFNTEKQAVKWAIDNIEEGYTVYILTDCLTPSFDGTEFKPMLSYYRSIAISKGKLTAYSGCYGRVAFDKKMYRKIGIVNSLGQIVKK